MASSDTGVALSIGCPGTEKLAKNYLLWKERVMSALRGAQIVHYLNPDAPVSAKEIPKSADKQIDLVLNPEYEA